MRRRRSSGEDKPVSRLRRGVGSSLSAALDALGSERHKIARIIMRALRPEKILSRTEHRPYPVPAGPWALSMSWHDLLFMHWPVPEGALRPWIPSPLSLDTFDGSAWLGITPFRMSGARPRFLPSIPPLSNFPELNVRTYVTAGGRPGIWFFSLDAGNPIAVRLARATFKIGRAHV